MPGNSRRQGQRQRWSLVLAALALRAVAGLAWPELGWRSPDPQEITKAADGTFHLARH